MPTVSLAMRCGCSLLKISNTLTFTDVQELDICDEQAIRAFVTDNRVDVIVNCAAYTAVDKAEDNPELCDKLNHIAPGYLAAAAGLAVLP